MEIEDALCAYLLSMPGVVEQIADRLDPLVIRQDSLLPAAAYQRVSSSGHLAHDGLVGMAKAVIQFSVQASTYRATRRVVQEMTGALDGHRGVMGTVQVDRCKVLSVYDGYSTTGANPVVRFDLEVLYRS